MLQRMHDNAQSWLTWAIVIVIVLAFALWGTERFFAGNSSADKSQIVASVNGYNITKQQLVSIERNMPPQFQKLDANKLNQLVKDNLINKTLLQQDLNNHQFNVSVNQIDQYIYSLPVLHTKGQFDPQKYQQFLQSRGLTTEALRQQLSLQMTEAQLRNGIILSDFTFPVEFNQYQAMLHQQRSIDYFVIKPSSFNSSIKITDTNLRQYYKAHQSKFFSPTRVKLDYILLSLKDLEKGIQLSPKQIEQYYADNKNNFRMPGQKSLVAYHLLGASDLWTSRLKETVFKELTSNVSLASIQKKLPHGLSIARSDVVVSDASSSSLKKVSDQFSKLGQFSEPVTIDKHTSIYQFQKVIPGKVKAFPAVKSSIEILLKTQMAEKKYSDLGSKLDNLSFENPDSLKIPSQQLGLAIRTTGWVNQSESGQQWFHNAKVQKAAFSDDLTKQHNNSSIINISSSQAVVFRVHTYQKAHQLSFDQAKSEVKSEYILHQGRQMAASQASQVYHQLHQGKGIQGVSDQLKVPFLALKNIRHDDAKINPQLLNAVFKLQYAKGKPNVKELWIPKLGYVVFKLQNVRLNDSTTDDKHRKVDQKQVQSLLGQIAYSQYLSALKANATIKEH